jgi:hypothetical protein
MSTVLQVELEETGFLQGKAKRPTPNTTQTQDENRKTAKMHSALFLILHTVTSTILLSSCAG